MEEKRDGSNEGDGIFSYYAGRFFKSTLARGATGTFIAKVAGAGLGFLSQIVLTRFLGAAEYGVYIYAFTWINLVAIVGTMGFTTGSVRFVSKYKANEAWGLLRGYLRFSRRFVAKLSVGLAVLVAAVTITVELLGYTAHLATFMMAGAVLPLLTQIRVRSAELRGLKWVVWAQVPERILRPFFLILSVPILVWVLGVPEIAPAAMGVHLASAGVGLATVIYLGRSVMPGQVRTSSAAYQDEEWFRVGRDMMLIAGFNLILFQADTIMVGLMVGTTEAGLYRVASKIATVIVFVLAAVNNILGPIVAETYSKGEEKKLQRLVTLGAWGAFIPSLVISAMLIGLDTWVLNLFGREFLQSKGILKILVLGQIANALAGPAVLLLNMTDHERESAIVLGLSSFLNVFLNAILIHYFGSVGAAVATAATMVAWNTASVWLVWKKIGVVSFIRANKGTLMNR